MSAITAPVLTGRTMLSIGSRTGAGNGLLDHLAALIRDWREAARLRRAVAETRRELARLSDHELDDLGLTRWDIDRVSEESVYGR